MGDRIYDSLLNVFEFNEKNNVIILMRILGFFLKVFNVRGRESYNRCTSSNRDSLRPTPTTPQKTPVGNFISVLK